MLFNEVQPDPATVSVAPRTLSIALWNICDLHCRFCYRPHTGEKLASGFIRGIATAADKLGTLEITFGGGEPLSYPELDSVCAWIWENTSLGISLTTHGHRLTSALASRLAGKISSIRFSIDGGEPYYRNIRGRPLSHLLRKVTLISGMIPFGINAVISPGHIAELRRVAEIAIELGSDDLLIIPEHRDGKMLLNEAEWGEIQGVIADYREHIRLYLTSAASACLDIDVLRTDSEAEFAFAHISADRKLKLSSHARGGIPIENVACLKGYFLELSQSRVEGRP